MRILILSATLLFVSGCDPGPASHPKVHRPATPGSNLMMQAPITVSDGLEVIISDVIIPPNASVERHFHPGEEFLYLIEGSAIHKEEGKPDMVLEAGDTYAIPPMAAHSPQGGPFGARAIVFRVHVAGQPERILKPEESAASDTATTDPSAS